MYECPCWTSNPFQKCTHRGKVRSMPPAVPMWLRMVKDVRMPRFRRAMQRPLVTATRRLFSGIACQVAASIMEHCCVQHSNKIEQGCYLHAARILAMAYNESNNNLGGHPTSLTSSTLPGPKSGMLDAAMRSLTCSSSSTCVRV